MVEVTNGKLDLQQRIDVLKKFLCGSNIVLNNVNDISFSPFIKFEIKYEEKQYFIYLVLKNIVNSGWTEKPNIKRIQIRSLQQVEIPKNIDGNLSILIGVCNVNGRAIIATWNPFMYTFHKSNRSCYVLVEDLLLTDAVGMLKTSFARKKLLLCNQDNFGKLLKQYIKDNAFD